MRAGRQRGWKIHCQRQLGDQMGIGGDRRHHHRLCRQADPHIPAFGLRISGTLDPGT